jgi:protein phosphatase
MQITIPDLSLVLLVGPSGCGKSTFAGRHFQPTEVLSSDFFRGLICDDVTSQAVNGDTFEVLHLLTAKRLYWRRFTVIDATNLKPDSRRPLLGLARRYHFLTNAIVFNLAEEQCQGRNQQRPQRQVPGEVVHLHSELLQQALLQLPYEHFDQVVVLSTPEEVDSVQVQRLHMPFDRNEDRGPFDIVGDLHGCHEEFLNLLDRLGYQVARRSGPAGEPDWSIQPPEGRKLIFVGDLVDRGLYSVDVLRLVMALAAQGLALVVVGNHDDKLRRYLEGRDVKVGHGLAQTLSELEKEPLAFRAQVAAFLGGLPTHYMLDGGNLCVAHAGLREDLQGRDSRRVRAFSLYGETTGETDEHGLPIRGDWGRAYTGRAYMVHGHTPVATPEWLNRTINIDTGCVFGGRLTALRYPEMELVSVPARRIYCVSPRPFLPSEPIQTEQGGEP